MGQKIYQFLNWISKWTKLDIAYVVKSAWWIFGRVFSFLASFLILIAFGKFVPKEVYGAYQYVISMGGIIGVLTLPGIDLALISAVARKKEKTFFLAEKEKLKWGFLSSLVFFSIASWYFFKANFPLAISFLILAIFYPFLGVFSLYFAFWQGKERFDLQNKYFVFHNFLGAFFLILTIILKPELVFAVFGYCFGFTFATFLFWLKTRKKVTRETEEEKEAIKFGKHLTIMAFPSMVAGQIDNIILWKVAGAIPVAVYAFALRLIERLSEIIPFSAVALPKMANLDFNHEKTKKKVLKNFLKLFIFSIPATLLYILFCPIFFKIFFPAYKESIIYSQVLSLVLILSPFSFLQTAFLAKMKKRELYVLNFASQIFKILLFFVLIPLFKIWGAVISILSSQILASFLTFYYFQKI